MSDLAGAAWSLPGHAANINRCSQDAGCTTQTLQGLRSSAAQLAGEIHDQGRSVLADPAAAWERATTAIHNAAADWIISEHHALTANGGFQGGLEAGHIFGTVEGVGLSAIYGGRFVTATERVGQGAARFLDDIQFRLKPLIRIGPSYKRAGSVPEFSSSRPW